jgi:hypothetical protein
MTRPPTILLLVPLLAAVALAACSSHTESYKDISDLAEAVSAAGIECSPVDPGRRAQLVSATGTCVGSGVTLYLFDRIQDLEDWKKVGTRVGPATIGPSWAVTGEVDELDRIAAELGGEVVRPND